MSENKKPLTDAQRKLIDDHIKVAVSEAQFAGKRYSSLSSEELKSIALLTLVEAAIKYDPLKASFKGFLGVLIKQAVIDAQRNENTGRKNILEGNMDELQSKTMENHQDLWFAIDALNDRDRQMIIDHYFVGLSQVEIAKNKNISTTSVCLAIKKARKKIKSNLH